MTDSEAEDPKERPRPRVVDKRVSARSDDDAPGRTAPSPDPEPVPADPIPIEAERPDPSASDGPPPTPPQWTPEQEDEARRLMEHMTNTPSLEWVANACVTLASLADTKLRVGDHADARLPIDALAGILDAAGTGLGDLERPLRQTLSQLQMAFAQAASGPTGS